MLGVVSHRDLTCFQNMGYITNIRKNTLTGKTLLLKSFRMDQETCGI
jgi:hypothetical protein